MKKCSVCGAVFDIKKVACPYCGSVYQSNEVPVSNEPDSVAVESTKTTDDKISGAVHFLNDEALFKIAVCKYSGVGMVKDLAEAESLFKLLAARGNHKAMYYLAEINLNKGGAGI